jgi:hypothetical protein
MRLILGFVGLARCFIPNACEFGTTAGDMFNTATITACGTIPGTTTDRFCNSDKSQFPGSLVCVTKSAAYHTATNYVVLAANSGINAALNLDYMHEEEGSNFCMKSGDFIVAMQQTDDLGLQIVPTATHKCAYEFIRRGLTKQQDTDRSFIDLGTTGKTVGEVIVTCAASACA